MTSLCPLKIYNVHPKKRVKKQKAVEVVVKILRHLIVIDEGALNVTNWVLHNAAIKPTTTCVYPFLPDSHAIYYIMRIAFAACTLLITRPFLSIFFILFFVLFYFLFCLIYYCTEEKVTAFFFERKVIDFDREFLVVFVYLTTKTNILNFLSFFETYFKKKRKNFLGNYIYFQ